MMTVNVIVRLTALVTVLLSFAAYSGGRAFALPAGDAPGELMFGGLPRTYQVYVPAGVDHPAGLVVNLHGAGMTGTEQAALTNYNGVADQYGFVVAYPDGIDFSWADGRGASVPDRQGVDDVGFLVAARGSPLPGLRDPSRPGLRHGDVSRRVHGHPAGL